jgi:OsmC-like protein
MSKLANEVYLLDGVRTPFGKYRGALASLNSLESEGDLDVRGTLGIEKDVPVGFKQIRLRIFLDADATPDERARLTELTERYCVVYQTLCRSSRMSSLLPSTISLSTNCLTRLLLGAAR